MLPGASSFDITSGENVTLQWSTVTKSDSSGQNYGSLVAYSPTTRFTFHHNLYAHHANRCFPHNDGYSNVEEYLNALSDTLVAR